MYQANPVNLSESNLQLSACLVHLVHHHKVLGICHVKSPEYAWQGHLKRSKQCSESQSERRANDAEACTAADQTRSPPVPTPKQVLRSIFGRETFDENLNKNQKCRTYFYWSLHYRGKLMLLQVVPHHWWGRSGQLTARAVAIEQRVQNG